MVSFFGLKLGSDRKKAQSKQAQGKPPQKWNRIDQNAPGQGQDFSNFARPQFPSSTMRPSTANSTRSASNWRAVFKNPAMTSSMVDLAPPRRRPSVGSLRHVASDFNMRSGTTLPTALGGSGQRPGTPTRPSGATKASWVNPLDVHFCKNPANTRPGTPLGQNPAVAAPVTPVSPKNSRGQFELGQLTNGHEADKNTNADVPPMTAQSRKSAEGIVTQTTYPSPPPSDTNSEGALSPVNVPATDNHLPTSSRSAPFTLREDVLEPSSLLGSVISVQKTSHDRREGSFLRNVQPRRDTFAFHQPRRRSFTMEFEESHRATMMQPPKEGFTGNFADFDFGESVARITGNISGTEGKPSLDVATRPSMSSEATKESDRGLASTSSNFMPPSSITQTEQEESRSPAPTYTLEDQLTNSTLIDQLPQPPREHVLRPLGPPSAAAGTHSVHHAGTGMGFRQGFESRFNSERWSKATPPRPLQPTVPPSATNDVETAAMNSSYGPPPDSGISYLRSEPAPQPTEKLPSSPFSRQHMEGYFPMFKGLPRGRRPGPPPLQQSSFDDRSALSNWSNFGPSDPRRSAIPAPLSPTRPSASQGPRSGLSTPTSATAPRIPSPTFSSLAKSISNSSDAFGKPFAINFEEAFNSPTMGGFSSIDRRPSTSVGASPRRVEAKRAPPRPAPVTLPPSPNKHINVGLRSPVLTELPGTFI